jgi:nucleotide-binding universal stress UspA family protein
MVVLHVQPPVPPRVKTMLGASAIGSYHSEEAEKVLGPIERFLKRHKLNFRTTWVVGSPSAEVVRVAKREKAHMIVMGTHGHGVIGRALMGSVAQSVVTDCDIPVLLVK